MPDAISTPEEAAEVPAATFVIPAYNADDTLERCIRSALRQQGLRVRVVVVDHGSSDNSAQVTKRLAATDTRVNLLELPRTPRDRPNPSRPLNAGFREALKRSVLPERAWVFRLDADDLIVGEDAIAAQLAAGGYCSLIMATLVFFSEKDHYAYDYGPLPTHRSLEKLRHHGLYSVAHHASAMRYDLLHLMASSTDTLYDESLDYGEDLDLTCKLLRRVDGMGDFAFVGRSCYFKSIGSFSVTNSISTKRLLVAHWRLMRRNPEIRVYPILRGIAELELGRVLSERTARRWLQRFAGRNGWYRETDYADVVSQVHASVRRGTELSGHRA